MWRFDLRKLFQAQTPQERVAGLALRPDLARAAVRLVADERCDAEVKRLEPLLLRSESVLMLIEGRSGREMGLLLLSTERVLFRPHGGGADSLWTIPLAHISTTESQVRSMTGRMSFQSADSLLEVDKILGSLADQFAESVRGQQQAASRAATATATATQDPLEELLELRSRRAAGTISVADYEAAKMRLLKDI